MFVFFLFF